MSQEPASSPDFSGSKAIAPKQDGAVPALTSSAFLPLSSLRKSIEVYDFRAWGLHPQLPLESAHWPQTLELPWFLTTPSPGRGKPVQGTLFSETGQGSAGPVETRLSPPADKSGVPGQRQNTVKASFPEYSQTRQAFID